MRFRVIAAMVHGLVSALVLGLITSLLYFEWYFYPNWKLFEADRIFGFLIGVDLCLGPLATFIVSSNSKTKKVMRRDWVCIIAVQIIALFVGVHALWESRPIAYVYQGNYFHLLAASDIDVADIEASRAAGRPWLVHWWSKPIWVYFKFPDDAKEASSLAVKAAMEGKNLAALPKYYWPLNSEGVDMSDGLISISKIKSGQYALLSDVDSAIKESGKTEEQLKCIPIDARGKYACLLIDVSSFERFGVFDLNRWPY